MPKDDSTVPVDGKSEARMPDADMRDESRPTGYLADAYGATVLKQSG